MADNCCKKRRKGRRRRGEEGVGGRGCGAAEQSCNDRAGNMDGEKVQNVDTIIIERPEQLVYINEENKWRAVKVDVLLVVQM